MPDILPASTAGGPALSATTDMPGLTTTPDPAPAPAATETAPAPDAAPAATDGAAAEPAADAGTPETADSKADPAATESSDTAGDTKPAKPDRGINQRFSELTNARKQAESRADSLSTALVDANATIKRLTERPAEPTVTEPRPADDPRPRRDTFDSPDAYDTALDGWIHRETERVTKAEIAKEKAETAKQTDQQQREAQERTVREAADKLRLSWDAKRAKALEEIPDYVEIAESEALPITNEMAFTIMQAENGPAIAYHLGKNPETAARIATLPPAAQMFELGTIAAELKVAKKPAVSKAPRPVTPLGSKAAATAKTPDEMSMDEYAAYRNGKIADERASRYGGARRN